jgi:hypothetical protein
MDTDWNAGWRIRTEGPVKRPSEACELKYLYHIRLECAPPGEGPHLGRPSATAAINWQEKCALRAPIQPVIRILGYDTLGPARPGFAQVSLPHHQNHLALL